VAEPWAASTKLKTFLISFSVRGLKPPLPSGIFTARKSLPSTPPVSMYLLIFPMKFTPSAPLAKNKDLTPSAPNS